MMKKLISLLLLVALMPYYAFATPTAETTDVENDIVSITTNSFAGETVSVLVINPGFTKEQALAGSDGAIQYYNSYIPETNDYTIQIKVSGNVGGKFKVYLLSVDEEQECDFTFYNSGFKKKCIDDINKASAGTDITNYFENLVNAYDLADNSAYETLGSKAVADAFLLIRDTKPGNKLPDSISEVEKMINESFVLAAYNTSNSSYCFSTNTVLHTDVLGIQNTAELNDYNTVLSALGVNYVKEKLISGTYTSPAAIGLKFKELVHRGVLLNYKELGYGHIHSYFKKYESAYENAGFIIPSKENREKYSKLLNITDESLSDIAIKFNAIKEETTTQTGSTKPSSALSNFGGNFSTGGSASYVDPNPAPITPSVESGTSFNDVKASHWAAVSVEFLKEKGWINGYDDGNFKPDNNITRAEFIKLVLNVFGIEAGGENAFSDVSDDAWYAPYVAAAYSKGIINGNGGVFSPDNYLTRQDAAVIICRIYNKYNETVLGFDDASEIADYAVSSVSHLVSLGVINGYNDNTFKPTNNITRAEISKIIYVLNEKGGIE